MRAVRHLTRKDAAKFLSRLDVVVFDCDGVLWRGDHAVPGCAEALSSLRRAGKRLVFLTNSSSKSRSQTRDKLDSFGLLADDQGEGERDIVVTSGFSAAQHLARVLQLQASPRPKVMALGGDGLREELLAAGLEVVVPRAGDVADGAGWSAKGFAALDPDPEVGAVVVGADPELTFAAVGQAALALQDPACAFLATNLDASVNVGTALRPRLMPEAGATVGAVSSSTGRRPVDCGKGGDWLPQLLPHLLPGTALNNGPVTASDSNDNLGRHCRVAMVGDRLDTDIAFGQQCGFATLLPLTGVTSRQMLHDMRREPSSGAQLESPSPWPDFVIDSVAELRMDE